MQRRFLGELALTLAISLIGALVLAVLWPTISPVLASLGHDFLPAAVAVVVAASILTFTSGRSLGLSS